MRVTIKLNTADLRDAEVEETKRASSEKAKSSLTSVKDKAVEYAKTVVKKTVIAVGSGMKKAVGALKNKIRTRKLERTELELNMTVEKTDAATLLTPAVCTQCGAALQVNPSQKEAVCPYCGTTFIVTEAISRNEYNVQKAQIHTDKVVIRKKSRYEATLDYLQERKKLRLEERRKRKAQQLKTGLWMLGILLVMLLILFMLYGTTATGRSVQAITSCNNDALIFCTSKEFAAQIPDKYREMEDAINRGENSGEN